MRTVFLIFVLIGVISATMGFSDVRDCVYLFSETAMQCKDEGALDQLELELCGMEKLGWITPEGTVDVAKAVDAIVGEVKNEKISEELRVATKKCAEAGNSAGNDKTTRVAKLVECWDKNIQGTDLWGRAFCVNANAIKDSE